MIVCILIKKRNLIAQKKNAKIKCLLAVMRMIVLNTTFSNKMCKLEPLFSKLPLIKIEYLDYKEIDYKFIN